MIEDALTGKLPEYLGPRAIQHCYTQLNSLLIYAMKKQIISRNPMDLVKRPDYKPQIHRKQQKYISRNIGFSKGMLKWLEQPDCLYHDQYPRILMMLLGLRQSEVLGLTWDCVTNLTRKNHAVITIKQELMRHEKSISGLQGWYIADRTKNTHERTILLPERWRKALMEEKAKNRQGKNLWNRNLIFLTPRGGCIYYELHSRQWHDILTAYYNTDKPVPVPLPDDYYFTPHTARHVCASIMIDNGMPITTVQEILGQLDAVITKSYIHTTTESKTKAVASLSDTLK